MKRLLTLSIITLIFILGCSKDRGLEPGLSNLRIPSLRNESYPVNGIILNEETIQEGGITCTQYTEGISATNTDFLPNNFRRPLCWGNYQRY